MYAILDDFKRVMYVGWSFDFKARHFPHTLSEMLGGRVERFTSPRGTFIVASLPTFTFSTAYLLPLFLPPRFPLPSPS